MTDRGHSTKEKHVPQETIGTITATPNPVAVGDNIRIQGSGWTGKSYKNVRVTDDQAVTAVPVGALESYDFTLPVYAAGHHVVAVVNVDHPNHPVTLAETTFETT